MMITDQSSERDRTRLEQRFADMKAILEAQQRLKAARRCLHLANLKRARRAARVEAALQAFHDSVSAVDVAQADLKVAQEANDLAFLNAANHALGSGK